MTQITSEHFDLHPLADGVYAAIGRTGGAAYSNAGIIDLGDQTLILDTFNTPAAAEDLRAAAETLTGRPAGFVIISHLHSDHWGGNQVFAGHAPIVATHKTREGMPAAVGWLQELKEAPSELETEIEELRKQLEEETDPRRRASLELGISRYGHILRALPTLELTLPNLTFERSLTFHGSSRSAYLHAVEPGHTDSDAYLLLPDDGISFIGDLGFFQCQPFMPDCEPHAWIAQLEQMERTHVDTFVPGHGPLGTKADLALQREYIAMLETLVAEVIAEGGTAEDALQRPIPAPFDAWLHGGTARFEANFHSSFERQSGKPPA